MTEHHLNDMIAEIEALLADTREVAKDGQLLAIELAQSIDGIVRTQTSAILERVESLEARMAEIRAKKVA